VVASESTKQSHMGHHDVEDRDGEKRRLKVDNNVSNEFSDLLSREDIVYAFSVAYHVERMRCAVLGGTERGVHQGEIMVGSER